MENRVTRTLLYFTVFFCLGMTVFTIINGSTEKSREIVKQEESVPGNQIISDVAAAVSPSIVGISSFSRGGRIYEQPDLESTGSGVILDHEGHIVTNNHVVKGADRIVVTLADGNEEEAEIIGNDPRTDLAVIKVKVDNRVTPIRFGDSNRLLVGQQVIAIGNPLGMRFARSVTAGIISGLNRLLTTEEGFTYRLIQTDAAINPGNSGGALVSLDGALVGINTVKIAAEGFEGMGFSIPSNQVKTVVEQLKEKGRVLRPLMGIKILGEISADQARYYKLPEACGVLIEPIPGKPADKAGLKPYDIICKIEKQEIQTSLQLQEAISVKKIGQKIRVYGIRPSPEIGGKAQSFELEVTLDG